MKNKYANLVFDLPADSMATRSPFWLAINPHSQILKLDRFVYSKIASMVKGPFFDMDTTKAFMRENNWTEKYTYALSGHHSRCFDRPYYYQKEQLGKKQISLYFKIEEEKNGFGNPYFVIIDPRQMFKKNIENVASMISGLFFNRDRAENYFKARRHIFSDRARVACLDGSFSKVYRSAFERIVYE